METYVKNKVIDITYKSELILDIFDVKDLIRTYNLLTLCVRKLCAH
jgi:hypothetical protein